MYPRADNPMLSQQPKIGAASTEAERQSVEPAGFPTLKLTRNGTVIQELSLDRPQVLIGRTDDNDISIPTPYVSQHHILLIRRGDSTILIDLNSTNGTFVNSERVYKHVLANDDVITVDHRSMFVTYSIEYSDPSMTAHGTLDDVEPLDPVIEKALANFKNLLVGGDTELLPTLSEDVPTVVGVIDDR
jgi:pSer/pThr/pTyr-binding forkhead associated (FHA) protein